MAILEKLANKEGVYIVLCPGCSMSHVIHTARYAAPRWNFNGDISAPTFSPSLLVQYPWGDPPINKICHSFIVDGKWQFLNDCTHDLAGQTVPMVDVY